MKYVCDGDFWRMIMNGDSVCRRQVIWPLEGNYGIFLQHYFVAVVLLILCTYGWISETKSVMICNTDFRYRTSARTPLLRMSMILAFISLKKFSRGQTSLYTTGLCSLYL